ncbi:unnamed protein product, partial [Brenthis ino]
MTLIVIRGTNDAQVRAAAANADLSSETIVSFLSIYQKPDREVSTSTHNSHKSKNRIVRPKKFSSNRPPLSNQICLNCKQPGHRSYHCPTTPKPPKSPITNCTFCKKPGHSENDCFAKARSGPHKQNVNLCSERVGDAVNNDITTAVVQDIPVDVLIDSGVINISLISSDALKYFSCNAKPTNCALKGLSNQEIVARSYVNLTFEFSEIAIEADLVVVPSNCISFPIIIGTDILNREGITYLRTKDKQCLTRSINVVSNADVNRATNEIKINTPLFGEELNP